MILVRTKWILLVRVKIKATKKISLHPSTPKDRSRTQPSSCKKTLSVSIPSFTSCLFHGPPPPPLHPLNTPSHPAVEVGVIGDHVAERGLGFELFLHRYRPPCGNLDPGREELDGSLPRDVTVPVLAESAIEASESEGFPGNGDSDVDAKHAGHEALGEPVGRAALRGVDAGGVAERVGVFNGDGILPRLDLENAENRSENFVMQSLVASLLVEDDSGAYPVPSVFGDFLRPSIEKKLGPRGLGGLEVAVYLLEAMPVDDGSHLQRAKRVRAAESEGSHWDEIDAASPP
jgi:hypothetical protein